MKLYLFIGSLIIISVVAFSIAYFGGRKIDLMEQACGGRGGVLVQTYSGVVCIDAKRI